MRLRKNFVSVSPQGGSFSLAIPADYRFPELGFVVMEEHSDSPESGAIRFRVRLMAGAIDGFQVDTDYAARVSANGRFCVPRGAQRYREFAKGQLFYVTPGESERELLYIRQPDGAPLPAGAAAEQALEKGAYVTA